MSRDWKHGDVALARMPISGAYIPVVRTEMCALSCSQSTPHWHGPRGNMPGNVADVRPVVVIDPEDRQQVERLRGIVDGQFGPGFSNDLELWQAALREFANPKPPKPAEPTGLGAVVEDADGRRWVRQDDSTGALPWVRAGRVVARWSEVAAVKVLSEGVTA